MGLLIGLAIPVAAAAQEVPASDTPTTSPASVPSTVAVPSETPAPRDPAHFKRFDEMREPMLTSRFPSLIDTITGDKGGWRTWLADSNIGLEAVEATNSIFPLRNSGGPTGTQQIYNGQHPTLQLNALTITATVGLNALGLPNTKLVAAGAYLVTSYAPNGPNTALFKGLYLYQSFADKTIEMKVGFNENYNEFVGLFAGGNPTLTSGLGTLIPIEVGLSAEPAPTPTFNLQYSGKRGFYVKATVQRSINPRGNQYEVEHHGIGLDFGQRGAKALYIAEVGLKHEGTPDQRTFWVRGGYIYNSSPYQRFLGNTDHNYAAYLLADYQLTRPDSRRFFRGLYVGASAESAPKSVNVFAKSAELRAYYVGMLAARPGDAINLTVTWNRYSSDFHKAMLPLGQDTERFQAATSLGYSLHAGPGITIAPALQYVVHPTPAPGYRNAVLGAFNVYLAF